MSYPTYTKQYSKDIRVGDKTITVHIGKFSEQVSAAVLAVCGETVVHTTVAKGREVDLGYFPLSVEFAEKLYAAGIIKGSQWVKRDGRPTDDAILKARVIDRTMRPLFPEGIKNEVQIINTVFSYDKENDPDMVGLIGTAVALSISDIPFDGPVAGVRVGYRKSDQTFMINPTKTELKDSDLDLIVSGTADSIVMVEAGANEVDEPTLVEAFSTAQKVLGEICKTITQITKEAGKEKFVLTEPVTDPEGIDMAAVGAWLAKTYADQIHTWVELEGRLQPTDLTEQLEAIVEAANAEFGLSLESDQMMLTKGQVGSLVYDLMKAEARRMIVEDGIRPDGRKTDEIRPIWCEVDVFPRTHGSAMFKRGATQAVSITTLNSPALAQHVESLDGEELRYYLHHYNMPPYASGEAGRFGAPKRREIGHGALAERALIPMIPSQEEFPYTIHVVTEILSSNGSTSMASVCGSTMSLMAAGVPLKRPVTGIAMGLITDGKGKFVVLSDIQGLEDHMGDMDFKVAGTTEGITALQMDIKIKGLSLEVMAQALDQAKAGRLFIMDKVVSCIAEPRAELSDFAPKIKQLTIPANKIGELIGPGGKMIKALSEETGAVIDVDEDMERGLGIVNISATDPAVIEAALTKIEGMFREVTIGEEFDGTVVRIEDYGAFVNYLPGRDGLLHVSGMSTEYVSHPEEILKLGDTVHVRIADIQDDGKIKLTMLTPEQEEEAKAKRGTGGDRGSRGGDRGGRPPFRGGRSGGSRGGYGSDRRGGRGGRSGGDRGSRSPWR